MKFLKQNKLVEVLSLNSISMVVSFVLGLFSTKIVSIYMGTSGMALLGSFKNFASMFKSLSTIGISNSIVKLVAENRDDKRELSIIYSTFFWVFLLISVALTGIIIIFSSAIANFLFFSNQYEIAIQIFGILLPLVVLNTFWIAIYNGLEKFRKIIIIQFISNFLVFSLTVLLIWKRNILGGLLAVALSEVLILLVTFLFVRSDRTYFQFDLQQIIKKKYIDVILKFSSMALLSAVIVPVTFILIRKIIVINYSIEEAGIWDAVNRLSGFYMMIFSSGLSLYYMPKLATLKTDAEFRAELKSYFTFFVPLFIVVLIIVYFIKGFILDLAFTAEFFEVKNVLIWQLVGDLFKVMTLAFGYQIVVKTMIKRYFFIELFFNLMYLFTSYFMIRFNSVEGALQAYFISNLLLFLIVLWMFRKTVWVRLAN